MPSNNHWKDEEFYKEGIGFLTDAYKAALADLRLAGQDHKFSRLKSLWKTFLKPGGYMRFSSCQDFRRLLGLEKVVRIKSFQIYKNKLTEIRDERTRRRRIEPVGYYYIPRKLKEIYGSTTRANNRYALSIDNRIFPFRDKTNLIYDKVNSLKVKREALQAYYACISTTRTEQRNIEDALRSRKSLWRSLEYDVPQKKKLP